MANKFGQAIGTSNNELDWASVKYLNVLHHNRTQKQLQHISLSILQKYYQIHILGTLDMSGHFHQKIMPTCRNFDVYRDAKNEIHCW